MLGSGLPYTLCGARAECGMRHPLPNPPPSRGRVGEGGQSAGMGRDFNKETHTAKLKLDKFL